MTYSGGRPDSNSPSKIHTWLYYARAHRQTLISRCCGAGAARSRLTKNSVPVYYVSKKSWPIYSNLLYEMGQNFLYIKYEYLQFYQNLCYRTPNRLYHIFCNYSTTLYVRRLILANMFLHRIRIWSYEKTGYGSDLFKNLYPDPTKYPYPDPQHFF